LTGHLIDVTGDLQHRWFIGQAMQLIGEYLDRRFNGQVIDKQPIEWTSD